MSNSLVLFFTKVNTEEHPDKEDAEGTITGFLENILKNKKTLKDIFKSEKAIFFLENGKTRQIQLEPKLEVRMLCKLVLLWDCSSENYSAELKRQLQQLFTQADDVFLALHDRSSEKENQKNYIEKELGNFNKNIACTGEYEHVSTDDIYDALSKVLDSLKSKKFNEYNGYLESLVEAIKKNLIKPFSLLKHRIAHLWLPLDIDLQGIKEVMSSEFGVQSSEEKKKRAEDYLKDVLTGKDGQFYRQKLADLQYMVAGEHVDFSGANGNIKCENGEINECNPVEPQDKENLFADDKSIYDLILESDKKDVIDSKEWQVLKLLSELEKIDEKADEKNPTNKIYKPIDYKNSPILQFMCYLDCLIVKCKKGEIEAPENLFTKEKELFETLNSKLTTRNPKLEISDFHNWFCALDDYLYRLRSKL